MASGATVAGVVAIYLAIFNVACLCFNQMFLHQGHYGHHQQQQQQQQQHHFFVKRSNTVGDLDPSISENCIPIEAHWIIWPCTKILIRITIFIYPFALPYLNHITPFALPYLNHITVNKSKTKKLDDGGPFLQPSHGSLRSSYPRRG